MNDIASFKSFHLLMRELLASRWQGHCDDEQLYEVALIFLNELVKRCCAGY